MKTLFVIPLHSAVSLITNSSSELFVCNKDKTIESVKDILIELLNTHNKISGENKSYDDLFGKIEVSKYTYYYGDVPQNLRDEYEKYERNPILDSWSFNTGYESTSEYNDLQEKDIALQKKMVTVDYKEDKDKYDIQWKEYRKEKEKLWKKWTEKKAVAKNNILLYWAKQNNLKKEQIEFLKKNIKKEYIRFNKENAPHFEDFFWEFETKGLFYGIKVKKGDILILSADDNSIPWEIQNQIESYLGTRYHLG